MRTETMLKLGQILGFLLMAAGVAVYVMNDRQGFSELMAIGLLVFAVCRLTAWLREK